MRTYYEYSSNQFLNDGPLGCFSYWHVFKANSWQQNYHVKGSVHAPMFIAALFTVAQMWKQPKLVIHR